MARVGEILKNNLIVSFSRFVLLHRFINTVYNFYLYRREALEVDDHRNTFTGPGPVGITWMRTTGVLRLEQTEWLLSLKTGKQTVYSYFTCLKNHLTLLSQLRIITRNPGRVRPAIPRPAENGPHSAGSGDFRLASRRCDNCLNNLRGHKHWF